MPWQANTIADTVERGLEEGGDVALKIVVIGGGVAGCSVAWHLAQRNLGEVLLIERDRIGSGTTWHSAGNLTWRPGGRFDAAVLYAFETIRRLTEETGPRPVGSRPGGCFLPMGPPRSSGWRNIRLKPRQAASGPG